MTLDTDEKVGSHQAKESIFLIIALFVVFTLLGGSAFLEGGLTGASISDLGDFTEGILQKDLPLLVILVVVILVVLILVIVLIIKSKRGNSPPIGEVDSTEVSISSGNPTGNPPGSPKESPRGNPPEIRRLYGKQKATLDENMSAITAELDKLGDEQFPPRSVTLFQNRTVEEKQLHSELRETNALLHGYRKPIPKKTSPTSTRALLDQELNLLDKELANIDHVLPKKAKVITTLPVTHGHEMSSSRAEKRALRKEKKEVTTVLKKSKRRPGSLIARFFPRRKNKKEVLAEQQAVRDVKRIAGKIERKYHHPVPSNEFTDLEEQINKLRYELRNL